MCVCACVYVCASAYACVCVYVYAYPFVYRRATTVPCQADTIGTDASASSRGTERGDRPCNAMQCSTTLCKCNSHMNSISVVSVKSEREAAMYTQTSYHKNMHEHTNTQAHKHTHTPSHTKNSHPLPYTSPSPFFFPRPLVLPPDPLVRLVVAQNLNALPECHDGLVDVRRLLQLAPRRTGVDVALAARQVNEGELAVAI